MVAASTILFLIGAAFCFLVVLPFAIQFLISYGQEVMTPIITFQLPVVGYFLGKIGIATPKRLGKGRPYAVIVFLIGAAVLSPPDIFTQILLAGPLYLLYEITIIIVRITGKKTEK